MSDIRQSFWSGLNERISQRPNTPLRETTRVDSETDSWRPQRHLADSVGYSFNVPLRKGEIMVYLVANRSRDREAIFDRLREHRDRLESEFGEELDWRPDDGTYKLILRRDADIEWNRRKWDEYQLWLITRAERLYFETAPSLAGFDAT